MLFDDMKIVQQDIVTISVCDETFYAQLAKSHRNRQFAMNQRKRVDLALGALIRQSLGWSKQLPTDERKAIAAKTEWLIDTGEKFMAWQDRDNERRAKFEEDELERDLAVNSSRKPRKAKLYASLKLPIGLDDPTFTEWGDVIIATLAGRQPMAKIEEAAKDRMNELAAHLPVAQWWRDNVFEGTLVSLATIIAETGDLAGYATVSKVWKRMGVAVMDGVRQGGLSKNASKDAWIAHGYVRRRRSLLYVIGEALIKGNDHYLAIYHAEKERQRAKAVAAGLTVAPSAKIPEKRKAEFISDGHIANRSRRYMEKQLLADLWCAWNGRAKGVLTPNERLPSQPIAEAE